MTKRICPQCKLIFYYNAKCGHGRRKSATQPCYSASEIRRMLARATGEKARGKWKALLEVLKNE